MKKGLSFVLLTVFAALALGASKPVKKGVITSGSHGGTFGDIIVPGTVQNLSFNATAASSSALVTGVTVVELTPTRDCYVAFGSAPVATSNDIFLVASQTRRFGVPTDQDKISVIRAAADGVLSIVQGAP